jgi:hypothetical protein
MSEPRQPSGPIRTGVVGELGSPSRLLQAIGSLRGDGYRRFETYTPYPVEGMEELLDLPRSPVPRYVLLAGIAGGVSGFAIQWFCNAFDYPLNVGSRPLFSWPAWIIVTFELTILFAGVTAVASCILLSRLPRLWDAIFEVDGFESASIDGFWLAISSDDPRYDAHRSVRELEALGARRLAIVDEKGATRPEAVP